MHRLVVATSMFVWLVALGGVVARADVVDDCRSATSAETQLSACSEVIASGAFSSTEKAMAFRNRGRARSDAGALDLALADLSEAIRLNPAEGPLYIHRGLVRVRLNDLAGAIADYSETIRLNPKSAIGYNGRGHAHLVGGDEKKAIADFSEAIALNPAGANTYNNRGLAYSKSGEPDRAIEDFTAAITINPIYALAYTNRGYVHEQRGRRQSAIEDFRRALLLDPSLVGARDGLRRLHAESGLIEETVTRIKEGEGLVETHCSGCHAVGRDGASPNPKAPRFRALHLRHPIQALREPLTRAIAAPHDEMPQFALPDAQIDKIVAYINSLSGR
jgi:tetratricopeptide (TPR) repeat protein